MAKMKASLNAKTVAELREAGYTATVVERYDPYTQRRHDLFGVIDVLAIGHGETIAVQATSRSNMASRRRKTLDAPELPLMLAAGWKVELWGWHQPNGPGTPYRVKIESFDR